MKIAAEKLALRFAGIYTAVTVLFSICMYMDGGPVEALQYVKLFLMFGALWLLTFLRVLLDHCQWGLRRHYLLKRMLFMPLYLGVTLVTLLHFGYPFKTTVEDGIFITVCFLIAFMLSLLIWLPRAKKQEQVYSEILEVYQKKLEERNL